MSTTAWRTGDAVTPGAGRASYRTVEVETPEQVALGFELADLGSRFMALVTDALLLILGLAGLTAVVFWLSDWLGFEVAVITWSGAVLALVAFAVLWGYFFYFEGFRDGQTPGKKRAGLRVVHDGGYPLTVRAAAVRNVVRIVDLQPGITGLLGGVTMMIHPRTKRLGDLAAGTIVVRDRGDGRIPEEIEGVSRNLGPPRLGEEHFQTLDRFLARRSEMEEKARIRVAQRLSAVLDGPLSDLDISDELPLQERLSALHQEEVLRRATAGAGTRGGSPQAAALVRAQRERWREYERLVAEAEEKGLTGLSEEKVSRFATLYRMVAADLARVRTYEGSGELRYALERLVGTGHNLFYRPEQKTWEALMNWLRAGFPRLVRRRWIAVAVATAALLGPGAVTYFAVRGDPGVARSILPAQLVQRAEGAPERLAAGQGYVDVPDVFMPMMSSRIISNNVQVTFMAFAGGVLAGVGTLALLVFNGVFLGAVAGLYDAHGAGVLLWTFVAPHGVIELTAIFISGGAGLWMGSALVLPGRKTRIEALTERAREAVSLLAGTTLLLILAGSIEGFVSPAPIPAAARLGVAAVVGLACLAYLAGAGRGAAVGAAPGSHEGADR